MQGNQLFESTRKARPALAEIYREAIEESLTALTVEMDAEINQEIRERIAALMFDEMVNDLPAVPYIAVWEDGAGEIVHAYMSPKIETLCGYSPRELAGIGYINIVVGDILSFYRDEDTVEEKIDRMSDVQEKRIKGFMDNRNWEGCYKIKRKDGHSAWVIDRSSITRFRNTKRNNILCLSGGILLETTELLEKRAKRRL